MPQEPTETTEQYVARLLESASGLVHNIEAYKQNEIRDLVEILAVRAISWRGVASNLQAQSESALREAERVQKLADDLAEVATRFKKF